MARLAYLDRLRVGAAMAVVMIHVSAMRWPDTPPGSADWQAMNVYAAVSRWCVPIFFMVSGALFLSPGRENAPGQTWRKYISRLLVMWVAWSAFYTVMSGVFVRTADPLFLLQHLWDGYYHLWYLLALTGVYALIPLLQRVVASPTLTRYFLILTGIPSIAVPTLAMVPVAGGLTADLVARVAPYLVAGYPFYFVLGHVLHEKGATLSRRTRTILYAAGIVGTVVTAVGTAWLSLSKGQPSGELYNYLSLGVVAAAVAVFLLFQNRSGDAVTSPRLATWARWTLPIYLIHPAFVRIVQEFNITPGLLPGIIGLPLIWLAVLALSTFVSALLVKIPVVNSWLV
ncbi:MAG TPA: acyltransferase family protein [Propionicimonas sp.]|nr:acyltransferase family protein [Propionicimonas sp.]